MKIFHPVYLIIPGLLICFNISILPAGAAATSPSRIHTLSIMPFSINAAKNLNYIRKGISHMLYSRLYWRDKTLVVPIQTTQTLLTHMNNLSKNRQVHDIANLTHSDFVVTGTLTELGGSFSIDVQVYDIGNKRYMAFFEQSKKKDALIGKVDRIAATINKKIFNRSTKTWEKMEEGKQAAIRAFKRRNPEYLMKNPAWQDTEPSPGWKIWKYLF